MTIQILQKMSIDELVRMYEIEYGNYRICELEPKLMFLKELRGKYVGTIKEKIIQISYKMSRIESMTLQRMIKNVEDKIDSAFYLLENMDVNERKKLLEKNIEKLQTL